MVKQLVLGNDAVCRTARRVLAGAEAARDGPSADLLSRRFLVHEKNA